MKKLLGIAITIAVCLAVILVYRAATVFEDRQAEPAAGLTTPVIDEAGAVQRFAGALTFPTVSYDDRSRFDAEAFSGFAAYLQTAYPRVHSRATRELVNDFSIVYHLPGSNPGLPPVLFMSHYDVVPVEDSTLDDWSYPPFSGTVVDGMVWGRGSLDDKVGVIALLEALELLLAQGLQPQRTVYLAFGHDEEVGGQDGAARVAEHFRRQGIQFDLVLDEGGALTEGMIEGASQPVAVIGISEKGYVNLVLTVEAPGGHSSQPPPQSALGVLARAIVSVEEAPFPSRLDHLMPTFDAIGAYLPFTTRLAIGNLWLLGPLIESSMLQDKDSAAGIRTTSAATMASGSPKSNILPTRATAVINFRILPGETVESVRRRVGEVIDDPRVAVRAEYGIEPSPVSSVDSRGYEIIARTIRAMYDGALVAPYMVRGGTDARYFHALSPNVYRFLPVRVNAETIEQVHGIDEHVPIAEYINAIRFYSHVIRQAAAG